MKKKLIIRNKEREKRIKSDNQSIINDKNKKEHKRKTQCHKSLKLIINVKDIKRHKVAESKREIFNHLIKQ